MAITFIFAIAFLSGINSLFINGLANSILNANSKMCKNCVHFLPPPQNGKSSEEYFGKCARFKYKYLFDNDNSTELFDNKFVVFCRLNESFCGIDARYYEEKNKC
jgi:hypothetical protein